MGRSIYRDPQDPQRRQQGLEASRLTDERVDLPDCLLKLLLGRARTEVGQPATVITQTILQVVAVRLQIRQLPQYF